MDGSDFAEQREELLQSIERDHEEVRVAVQELTEATQAAFDLGEHIKKRPLTWMLGALVVGIWLGSRAPAPYAFEQRRE